MTTKFGKDARAVADVTQGMLLATVDIAAAPERVFRALTTEELLNWWGSRELYTTTKWSGDVRPQGHWRTEGVNADGTPFSVGGEFLEVEPPHKLVMTWRADWDGGHVTTITYRLEALIGGTRLTVRHEGFGERVDSCREHTDGWERVLEWLRAHFPTGGTKV